MPRSEPNELGCVFQRLRGVLLKHAGSLVVTDDTPTKYCLEAKIGPATLQSWGGSVRRPSIPVAWVETGKAYVSYHLMGIAMPAVQDVLSKDLKARMHGRTCFNFKACDDAVLEDLETVTSKSIAALAKAGFVRT